MKQLAAILLFLIGSFVLFVSIGAYLAILAVDRTNSRQLGSLFINPVVAMYDVLSSRSGESLSEVVGRALSGADASHFGIAIVHLKRKDSFYLNHHRVFDAASLYKLWIMATVYKQISTGSLSEEKMLSQEVQVLNQKFAIASEEAEMTEGGINLSVGEALTKMITISHNYAALLLSERVGISKVKAFLKQADLADSSIGQPPRTTAYDTALFFKSLYDRKIVDNPLSEKMLDLLKKQHLDHKIPKYLPVGTKIAHKTGEIGRFTHDAGIVYAPNGAYIIVVLSESSNPKASEERIAILSQAVYEYFEGR